MQIIDNENHEKFYKDLDDGKLFDLIIIQRDIFDLSKMNLNDIKSLFQKIKQSNIKTIFDLDDDLLNIDKNHVSYERFSKIKDVLKFILINSDIVTVSTDYLKNQLSSYNKNIIVIPNTLMNLFNFKPTPKIKNLNSKKTIKIGYFGTRTHGNDIQLIKTAILNVKKKIKNKEIILEVVGVCPDDYNWIKKINMPQNYKNNPTIKDNLKNILSRILCKLNILQTSLPYCSFIKWIKNETNWDIGIAPLEDNNINRSKSNLKYLEYTALNIPGIYSDIGPYKDIKLKKTGLVVNNNVKEWEDAFINLIENEELYETLVNNAYKDVKENYMVEDASLIWKQILIKI